MGFCERLWAPSVQSPQKYRERGRQLPLRFWTCCYLCTVWKSRLSNVLLWLVLAVVVLKRSSSGQSGQKKSYKSFSQGTRGPPSLDFGIQGMVGARDRNHRDFRS